MYGGINIKPNAIHTYIPLFDGRYTNITLETGTLTLSKGLDAYNIVCSTNDNVTTYLSRWFYLDSTIFIAYAENETSLTYSVNGRSRGEPRGVIGTDVWSYNETSTSVSLTISNNTQVTIVWFNLATRQTLWFLDRIPMWMGIGGLLLCAASPTCLVIFGMRDDWETALPLCMGFAFIGVALLTGWLWG